MKIDRFGFRARLAALIVFSIVVTAWNTVLSSRRRNFQGEIVKTLRQDVLLTVRSPSKIEPRVQVVVRSLVRGRKKTVLVREGDEVKKGQLLAEITDDEVKKELKSKTIAFENASSDAIKAYKDLQLIKTLFRKGAASSREVDDAKRTLVRVSQTLDTNKEELAAVKLKVPGVRVTAPMAGTVLNMKMDKMDDIAERSELMTVARLDDFVVRGRVDELEIASVRVGQDAIITCDAFRGTEMPGKVRWVGSQAREGAFSEIEVVIDIIDLKGLQMKSNLSGVARIIVEKLPNVLVIPADAVQRDSKGPYVLKENFGGWLTNQPVTIDRVTDKLAVISKGLEEGEGVLVSREKETGKEKDK
jgi:RND family efflux transporter MFP subunit